MPKTSLEKFVFSLMMSLAMVIGMETYNQLLIHADILANLPKLLLVDLPLMTATVMLTQYFAGGALAAWLAGKIGMAEKPCLRGMLTMSCCTVLFMCPLMSAWATLFFKLSLGHFPRVWLNTFLWNLPMAFCWQLLVAGPSVRGLFHHIFRHP